MKIKLVATNTLPKLMLVTFTYFSPILTIAQGIGSPNGDGSAPTGEGAVPFDENMNLLFLVLGIAFALMIVIKQLRKKDLAGK